MNTSWDALADQVDAPTFEVVVVDNGSSDATAEIASSYFQERLRGTVVPESKPGLNVARNAGVSKASSDFILICDGDDTVTEGWVAAFHRSRDRADALGGSFDMDALNDERTREIWATGGIHLPDGIRYDFMPSPYGGNCAFDRRVWVEVGGFDETMTRGGDDFEFFWRAQLAGFSVGFVPEAVLNYRMRPEFASLWTRQFRFGCGSVDLWARFRGLGLPRTSTRTALKVWGWHILTAPWALRSRGARAAWVRAVAKRSGRLVESFRQRTYYP